MNKQIIFVDSSIANYQTLIQNADLNAQIVILDANRNGIEQITEALAHQTEITSIHIISHGSSGSLQLGNTTLNNSNLNTYNSEIETWRNALTENADILLYGCDVATGETGLNFVQNLSEIVGVDIAASDDITGNQTLGGDWDLEVKTGDIETNLAVSKPAQATYDNILGASDQDTGFAGVGGYNGMTQFVRVQADGKIVSGGYGQNSGVLWLARHNSDGTPDSTFNGGNIAYFNAPYSNRLSGMVVDSNGYIVALGNFSSTNSNVPTLIRYNPSGIADTGFTGSSAIAELSNLTSSNTILYGLAQQSNGNLLVQAYADTSPYLPSIYVYNSTGGYTGLSLKPTDFADYATYSNWSNNQMLLQPDDKIIVAAKRVSGDGYVVLGRYNSNGSVDTSFGSNGLVQLNVPLTTGSESVYAALQSDGKILVATVAKSGNGDMLLARFFSNGTLDTSFGSGGTVVADFALPFPGTTTPIPNSVDIVREMTVQPDGKIIVVVTDNFPNPNQYLIRYNSNGTLDTSFGTNGRLTILDDGNGIVSTANRNNFSTIVDALVSEPDGQLLVAGGGFNPSTGSNGGKVARFGTPDIALNTQTVAAGNVTAGSTNQVLYQLKLDPTTFSASYTTPVSLKSFSATTTGSYLPSDISNFKLYYSADATFDVGDTPLGTVAAIASGGTLNFTNLTQNISLGSTGYLFITADIAAGAANNNTIRINTPALNNIQFVSGKTNGSLAAGETQTILSNPTITSVTSSLANGNYNAGTVIPIAVTFNQVVNVTGTPQLTLNTGAVINYTSGTGSDTLIFEYTVGATDTAADLDYASTTALAFNGATIKSGANFDAELTLPTPGATNALGANKAIAIDTTAAAITNITSTQTDGTYGVGTVIPIAVTFSETVNVTGTPQLTLNSGATANYLGGSGTNTLTFSYTVAAGETAADLDYSSTNALSLNGGTIKDAATNDATLTLPAPGGTSSLGANQAIVIDAVGPTVSNVVSTSADGSYSTSTVIPIAVTFTEAVTVTGTPQITLNTGGVADYASGSGTDTLTFNYTVGAGENTTDLDYTNVSALILNGGTIKDPTNNDANLTLATPGNANSLGANNNIAVDTQSPTITAVSSTVADGSYGAGAVIPLTVTFSEAVNVTGTPQLTLSTGTAANYVSGSGTNTLTFNYTVGAGENLTDLDYASTTALSLNGGTIQDATNNNSNLTLPSPGGGGSLAATKNIDLDTTPPTVTIGQDPGQTDPTAGGTINFAVVFSEAVTGFDGSDITLGGTANPTNATVTPVGVGGTTYNVAVTGMSAIGTVTANVNAGGAADAAGNTNTASTSTDNQVSYDNTFPTVAAISRSDINPSNAANVNYTVTFSENVTGVDAADFNLTGTAAGTSITSVTGTGSTYTVAVNTGTSDGTVQLNLTDDDSIINGLSVPLGGAGTGNGSANGQIYTIDKTAATVTAIGSPQPNGNYRNGAVIPIALTFNEVVTVTGTPTLALNSGGTATYVSGSNTNTLTFNYTIAGPQKAADLEVAGASALSLNGGTLKDLSNNDVSLTVPTSSLSASKNLLINANEAPTNIALAGTSVAENTANGTVFGSFSATDPDPGNTHTYNLVDNAGGRFAISGNSLQVANGSLLDFETATTHNIRVRATDNGDPALSFEKDFAIALTNANDAPTNISLSSATVAENSANNTAIGTFTPTDTDAGQSYSYALVNNAGGRFAVSGDRLVVANGSLLDFEAATSQAIRVRVTDNGNPNLSYEKDLTVAITNVNEAPTDVGISSSTVAEKSPNGTLVGTLTAVDPDAGNTFSYTLPNNAGGRFAVEGNQLKVANGSLLDFNTARNYTVRVKAADSSDPNLAIEKDLILALTNVNDAPTAISINNTSVAENSSNGTAIGTLNATDPDGGDSHTYILTNDASGRFKLQGNQLQVVNGTLLDFEAIKNHTIGLRATDNGNPNLSYDRDLTVNITNVNEAPTNLFLTAPGNVSRMSNGNLYTLENLPKGTGIAFINSNDPDGDALIYTLLNNAGGRYQLAGGTLTVADSALFNYEQNQQHTVRLRGTDPGGFSLEKDLTINLDNVNEAPVFIQPLVNQNTEQGQSFNYTFDANTFKDEDFNDSLTYTATKADGSPLPAGLTLNSATRSFSGTPTEFGNFDILLKATDKAGLSVTASPFQLNITPGAGDLADGIETSLAKLQESLNTYIPSDMPILGEKLKVVLPGFLNTIKDNLTVRLREGKGIQDSQLEGIFKTSLGGDFPDLQVKANVGLEESTFQLNLSKEYTKDMPLAADFGLPALGLKTDGTGAANFKYDLSLGFGINKKTGFFLDTKNTYLNLDAGVGLSNDFSARGNLGFLQLDMKNNPSSPTEVGANFKVKLNDIDNIPGAPDDGERLTLQELKGQYQASNLYKTSFDTNANLGLKAVTSLEGSAAIPSFLFDVNAAFPLLKYENGKLTGPKKPKLEFKNMQLDLGTFISDFAKPIITTVNDIVEPVRPLINVLSSDIKPLSQIGPIRDFFDGNKDKKVTLIEAGATLAGKKIDTRFLDAIQYVGKASQLLKEISVQDGTIKIDLGDYELDFDATDPKADSKTATKKSTKSPGASPSDQAKSKTTGKTAEFLSTLQNMPGLSFPILSDPGTAIDLLLGKPDVTLFAYKVPKLEFDFNIKKDFPIYSIPVVNIGVNGVLEGSFSAKANLGFGFDTYGLSQWKESGFNLSDSYKVLDGLYVSDRENADATGPDVNELKLKASLGVGANLSLGIAKAGVVGGVEGIAKLDLLDVGEENGTSDGKIRGSEIISRIKNPLNLFEINGEVNAFLDAKAEYYKPFSWNTAWEQRLAKMKLADFRLGTGSTRKSRAIDGYLSGSLVFLDANFNGVFDDNEPFSITNPDGSFDITIETEKFDTNKNGQIDSSEGKFVLNGGMDVSTYLPLVTPLASTPESTVITPLTTVIAELVATGTSEQEAQAKVKTALGLPANVDIASFDPLEAIANNDVNGVTVFAAMIQVQNTIVQTAKYLEGVSQESLEQLGNAVIAAITKTLQAGVPVDLSKVETIQTIVAGAIAKAAEKEPNLNAQQLTAAAATAAQVMALGNQLIQEIVASGQSLKDMALEITKLQAVSVGQIAVGLPELAAGIVTPQQFLANNTKEAIVSQVAQAQVNDPTIRPSFETIAPEDLLVPLEADSDNTSPVTQTETTAAENALVPVAPNSGNTSAATQIDTEEPNSGDTSTASQIETNVAAAIEINTPKISSIDPGNPTNSLQNQLVNGNYLLTDEADSQIPLLAFNRPIFGLSGNDNLNGTDGNDTIYGNKGADTINGGNGNDNLFGGKQSDLLSGGRGDDFLSGNNANDTLSGGDGNDVMRGAKGNDVLIGGNGDDELWGDKGFDVLTGGAGRDNFVLQFTTSNPALADTILDFTAEDKIKLVGITFSQLTFESVNVILDGATAVASTAIKSGNNYLGVVYNVNPTALNSSSFL